MGNVISTYHPAGTSAVGTFSGLLRRTVVSTGSLVTFSRSSRFTTGGFVRGIESSCFFSSNGRGLNGSRSKILFVENEISSVGRLIRNYGVAICSSGSGSFNGLVFCASFLSRNLCGVGI